MADLRVTTPTGAEAALGESVIEEFASKLRGELLRPGDPDYEKARLVWNDLIDKRPALIARCTGVGDEAIGAVVANAENRPSPLTPLIVRHLGGAISRVPEDATAYGNRDAQFNLSIDSTWEDPIQSERNIAWTREVWTKMRQFSDGGIYLNFAGFLEEGEKLLHEAHGENYERLVALKNKYDPTNHFRLNHNIKPTIPEA
jgi:hypothetical protein